MGTVSIPVKSIGHTHPDKSQRINDHSSSHRSHVWVPVSNSVHPGAQLLCDLYYNSAKVYLLLLLLLLLLFYFVV